MAEVPDVPETDENSKQIERNDSVEDDEEQKSPIDEESNLE